ncbi:MAG: DUF4340 domain-containing protein [Deltaproteobacteria bacterium]|nr:MAG: DUF4340 domain-containing protein [Deltaproteobacteria bacterium]
MTWRRIGLYYALAALLGGYFFLFEWRLNHKRALFAESRPVQQSRFLPIARDDIQEVLLRRDQATVSCRRDGQRWKVIEPAGAQVPSDLLTSFVENLTPEKEVRVINEAPQDLAAYGLDHPRSTILVKDKEGRVVATVSLGDQNPTSSLVYVKREPAPQVFLLGQSLSYYEQLIFEAAGLGKQ